MMMCLLPLLVTAFIAARHVFQSYLSEMWYLDPLTAHSRLVDHRHGPGDVVAGVLVGGAVGCMYAARTIALLAPPLQLPS